MSKFLLSSLFIVGASALTYSRFQLVDFGSTSNPIFLLSAIFTILAFNKKIPRISADILLRACIYIPFSSLIYFFFFKNEFDVSIDYRFLLTSACFLLFSSIFTGFGVAIARSSFQIGDSFFSDSLTILRTLLILLCSSLFINFVGLNCFFFKCRELSSRLGVSLINSEPAYVGIFLFFMVTAAVFMRINNIFGRWHFTKRISTILLAVSIIAIGLSKSPLIAATFVLYAASILFVLLVFPLLAKFKLKKFVQRISRVQILFLVFLCSGMIYAIFFTKIGPEFYSLIDPSSYAFTSKKVFDNPIEILVHLGGNRLSYLFSLMYINPSLLIFGHSLQSSSLIFEGYVQQFFDNVFSVGFFVQYGAKPNSALIQLLFTFGLFGSVFIFFPVFKLFFTNLFFTLKNNLNFSSLWISFSPLFILLYPCPNTDPWKFLTLSLFVAFTTIQKSSCIRNPLSTDY